MSAKLMGQVYDSDLKQGEKAILLAYADHADHNGENVYPSVGLIAWKTGYSERAVQYITKDLVAAGYLVPDGKSKRGTNRYKIDVEALPKRPPYIGVQPLHPTIERGATIAPLETRGVQIETEGGAMDDIQGCNSFAPEPSVNHQLNHQEEEGKTADLSPLSDKFSTLTGILPYQLEDWILAGQDMTAAGVTLLDLENAVKKMRLDNLTISHLKSVVHVAISCKSRREAGMPILSDISKGKNGKARPPGKLSAAEILAQRRARMEQNGQL